MLERKDTLGDSTAEEPIPLLMLLAMLQLLLLRLLLLLLYIKTITSPLLDFSLCQTLLLEMKMLTPEVFE